MKNRILSVLGVVTALTTLDLTANYGQYYAASTFANFDMRIVTNCASCELALAFSAPAQA